MTNHSVTVKSPSTHSEYRWQSEPIAPPIDAELFRKGQCVAAGKISQVGPHGLLVETAAEFPEDAYLQVRFAVLEQDQLVHYEPFGRVVSCSTHGVGLLLDVLEPAARDALQALLAYGTRGAQRENA
ncbi:MAG: hypothetical protein V2J55_19825 [Candidatus Competibacteraceae bacterium]|nr:hypothetical protein [Candidatus Competibacteraceae bacterium]